MHDPLDALGGTAVRRGPAPGHATLRVLGVGAAYDYIAYMCSGKTAVGGGGAGTIDASKRYRVK